LSVGYWQLLAADFWKEVRSLVRIQRFDRDEPALLAPGQGFFLRENLKLRLLNARLALLSRDQWTFRNELRQAHEWIERYFDGREKSVQASLGSLKQLSATEVSIELPLADVPPLAARALDAELHDQLARELARRIEQRITAELPRLIESALRDFLAEQEMISASTLRD